MSEPASESPLQRADAGAARYPVGPGEIAFPEAGSRHHGEINLVGELLVTRSTKALAQPAARGGGTGDGFAIDVEQAERALVILNGVLYDLEAAMVRWVRGRVVDVGPDPVSVRVSLNIMEMNRRAGNYLEALTEQVREARAGLRAQIDGYRQVEEQNRDSFS